VCKTHGVDFFAFTLNLQSARAFAEELDNRCIGEWRGQPSWSSSTALGKEFASQSRSFSSSWPGREGKLNSLQRRNSILLSAPVCIDVNLV